MDKQRAYLEAPTGDRNRPVAPSRTDRFVRFASQLIGGPLGAHAVDPPRRRFWSPFYVTMAVAIGVLALAWLQKSPCVDGGWTDNIQYSSGCYSDVRALWGAERFHEGAVPYKDHPVEYPVLTGWFMGLWGQIAFQAETIFGVNGGALFFNLNAIVLGALALLTITMIYLMRTRYRRDGEASRPWDAMMLVATPVMIVTAYVNWDLLAVAGVVAFFFFWQREKHVTSGLFLGLAVTAKFYPLLFAGPMLVLALRREGFSQVRLRHTLTTLTVAAFTWTLVNGPVAWLWPESWMRFFELNSERYIDWGTLWYVLKEVTPVEQFHDVEWVNTAYFVVFALCCLGIAALAYFAPRRPELAQLCFLVVAAFVLTGKVWSQQYVLWLLPLLVLARPRWTLFVFWQVCELVYFFAFYGKMLQVSTDAERGISEATFLAAAGLRWVALAVVCGFVVRDVLSNSYRATGKGGSEPTPTDAETPSETPPDADSKAKV
ncbi:glycosyltransferase family 87 protein [Haloglycomyces albus]|uniref:glycosyltransferase family 87 protein n=1 Tax=Haloglycomyces albus TaxID=526067 RepID=UPI000A07BDA2|nr:glycosyltransferase 87 family protein [Haloglycomyces albus]